ARGSQCGRALAAYRGPDDHAGALGAQSADAAARALRHAAPPCHRRGAHPPALAMIDLDVHLPGIVLRDKRAFGAWMAGAEPTVRYRRRSLARGADAGAVPQGALPRVGLAPPRFGRDDKPNGLLRLAIRMGRNLAVSEVRRTRARPAGDAEIEAGAEVELEVA